MILSTLIAQGDPFGEIDAPAGVAQYNDQISGGDGIGLLIFASNIINLVFIIAGIWAFFNFIMAGWIYLTSNGDSKATGQAVSKISMSVIGLIVIVASYGLISLVGLLIFGKADFFLDPQITGPTP